MCRKRGGVLAALLDSARPDRLRWRVASSAPPSVGCPSKLASGGKGDHVLGSLSITRSEGVAGDTDRSVRDRMTTKKHLKRRVRSRAAQTGEPYATALRSLRQQQENPVPSTPTPTTDVIASCSFCGKPDSAVQRLVAGPGVYICNECIELSATIIDAIAESIPEESSRRRSQYYDRSSEDILALLPALVRSANRVEGELAGWINRLRELGSDWQTIAGAVDMSVDAVRQRFENAPLK